MAGHDSDVDTAESETITLQELYKKNQDHLVLIIKKSLDFGKKSLAARLDDVLLRQKFWEEDIGLEDGALCHLETNDAVASSIFRRYLDDIRLSLYNIDEAISESYNETKDENTEMSLLYETNTRMCDQVEIFDAIAAIGTAKVPGNDRKATSVSQLRHQLEEEDEALQAGGKNQSQAPSALSPLKELEVAAASTHSNLLGEKRGAGLAVFSDEPGPTASQKRSNDSPTTEDKAFDRPSSTWSAPIPNPLTSQSGRKTGKGKESDLQEADTIQRVRDKHAVVMGRYRDLVERSGEGSDIRTAIKIECARSQLWGDHVSHDELGPGLWNRCESIKMNEKYLLMKLLQLGEDLILDGFWHSTFRDSPRILLNWGYSDYTAAGRKEPIGWLKESIRDLSSCNDGLVDLFPRSKRESLRRQLRIMFSTYDAVELQHLKSASYLLRHGDLGQIASSRELLTLYNQDPRSHEDLSKKLGEFSLWLDTALIDWPSMLSANPGTVTSSTYRNEEVIIQWLPPIAHFERFLACASQVWNFRFGPPDLSRLHIIGYVDRGGYQLGCVYRSPPRIASTRLPVTLSELLQDARPDTVPELGKRLKLASALVTTVHGLHIMGLAHGGIKSENILFWPTATTEEEFDLSRPYLIGFDYHNRRRFDAPSDFLRDVRLLGLVLEQVAHWPLTSRATEIIFEEPSQKVQGGSLSGYVGRPYADAVKVCFSGELDNVFDGSDWDSSLRAFLHQVQMKVVDPIAMVRYRYISRYNSVAL